MLNSASKSAPTRSALGKRSGPTIGRQPAMNSAVNGTSMVCACLPVSSLLCGNIITQCRAAGMIAAAMTPNAISSGRRWHSSSRRPRR